MITNNLEHKKAKIEKVLLAGKVAISITVAGTLVSTVAFVYTNFINKHDMRMVDDFGNSYSSDFTTLDMIQGDLEDKYLEDVSEKYYESFESTNIEDNIQDMDLVYKEGKKDSDVVEVSDQYRRDILYSLDRADDIDNPNVKITVGDLKQIQELSYFTSISVCGDSDISWLNYCENLSSLHLEVRDDSIRNLNQIKSLNIKSLSLDSDAFTKDFRVKFDEDYFSFLRNCENLSSLKLNSRLFDINTPFLSSLNNKICLELDNYSINSSKLEPEYLKNLFSLDLNMRHGTGLYDFAYLHSVDDINNIKSMIASGMKMRILEDGKYGIDNSVYLEDAIGVRNQIDNVISSLTVNDKMNDEEKLKIVLDYVLNNLHYSETSANIQAEKGVEMNLLGQQPDELVDDLTENSYKDGYLYGALNKNGKPVCGSYAALMKSLLDGVGVEAYFTESDYHAYNLVNVDGEYFYVDATALDSDVVDLDKIIKSKEYMIDPNFTRDVYNTNVMPDGVVLSSANVEKKVEEVFYNAKKEYLVKFNNQVITVSFTVLMAILINLGLAGPKKKLEEIERLEREEKRRRIEESWKEQRFDTEYNYNPLAINDYEVDEISGRAR